MKSRLVQNLILAVAVAGLAAFLLLKPEKSGSEKYRLSTLAPGDVTRLTFMPAQRAPIVLEKQGQNWRMTAPFVARADATRVEGALEILQAQSAVRLPAQDLEKFELDKPLVVLKANDQEFVFGGRQPVSNEIYVASGGHVYLVPATFLLDIARPPGDYASRKPLAEGETPTGFSLPGLKLSLKEGHWQRDPDEGKLSADQLNAFADEWRLAIAQSVAKASQAKALDQMQVHLANGKTLTFGIIAREPDVVLRREDEGLEYHFPSDVGANLLHPAGQKP